MSTVKAQCLYGACLCLEHIKHIPFIIPVQPKHNTDTSPSFSFHFLEKSDLFTDLSRPDFAPYRPRSKFKLTSAGSLQRKPKPSFYGGYLLLSKSTILSLCKHSDFTNPAHNKQCLLPITGNLLPITYYLYMAGFKLTSVGSSVMI